MFNDLNVLITGGTGSFGRKFTEIMLKEYSPRRLIILSRDELKQHEMRQLFPDTGSSPVRYFIGDVRDRERLYRAFNKVDVIIHAAALKQVPACEYNPFEAVQTNIIGAKNVIDAAIDRGVERTMAISTDKAVNPINLYGATKLCAEKMFIQANAYSGAGGTRFSVCRYGNVAGSRGSVIPLFKKQRESGTVTVTDPRMTRFLINLDQGVKFVMRCTAKMHGGEIFVPKIASARMVDLTEAVAPGCNISYIGIRPGEKLHEVLVSEDEARQTVEMDDMYIILPEHPWWNMENWPNSRPMEDGSRYSSDANCQWFSVEEIRRLAEGE
ncbi:MAG: UDP-N-acetylglucosamine 4,6-dehydratase (inverting) [Methanotrichaceae archaeon]|nr:UDP-N-acetylglucosamine 4,6-dehydratase (inverting) [Methanotrichaceae archaeon]MDD1757528.1 UDP-N-acetylglucosamine 4,6-dehydratase (inverting) [Methanotrichaceae archaeon]